MSSLQREQSVSSRERVRLASKPKLCGAAMRKDWHTTLAPTSAVSAVLGDELHDVTQTFLKAVIEVAFDWLKPHLRIHEKYIYK